MTSWPRQTEMVAVMLRLFCLTGLSSVLALSVTDNIARAVTHQITHLSPGQISEKIELHYRLLGLIDTKGRWVHQYFQKCSHGTPCFPRYRQRKVFNVILV